MQSREDAAELATAIGEAIAVAADRLKEVEARSRVLILLSDGGESVANQGDPDAPMPQEAARVAAALGIKIYTIAFGSDQMQLPLAVPDRFGGVQIQHVHASRGFAVDEKLLREVAEIGQGKFFRATSTDALRDVYAEIDRLEKTKTEGITFVEYRELYLYPLLVGLGLLLLHLAGGLHPVQDLAMRHAMNTERLENGAATGCGPGAGHGAGRISPDRGRVFAGCGPGSTVDGCAEGIWLDDWMTGRL